MKWLGCFCLAVALQGCFFKDYFNDSTWAYFEEWDANENMSIDKQEFMTGYETSELFKKLSPKSQPVTYEEFTRFLSGHKSRSEEDPSQKFSIESFDTDSDKSISEAEMAAAMFVLADDNGDSAVTSLEFYDWEVYL